MIVVWELLTFWMSFKTLLAETDLIVLHTNDLSSRIEQADVLGGPCSQAEDLDGLCWGGYPRIISKVKEIRSGLGGPIDEYSYEYEDDNDDYEYNYEDDDDYGNGDDNVNYYDGANSTMKPNVVFMDAGEQAEGTLWYAVHRWRVIAYFMNLAGYDVATIGNHDFDLGVENAADFLKNLSFPVVSTNIDAKNEPLIRSRLKKSVVLTLESGLTVGVVGYTNVKTPEQSSSGKLRFRPVIESLKEQVKLLKADPRVKIIIALGDDDFAIDKEIARLVEGVDLVVGGDSRIFLWPEAEPPPSVEVPQYNYPYVVKNVESGIAVPIVNANKGGKYLGQIRLTFNDEGELIKYHGAPIALDKNVEQDPDVLEELKPWRKKASKTSKNQIGRTNVYLEGDMKICHLRECNLGNLVTDAAIYKNIWNKEGDEWNEVAIALYNSGGIKGSVDEKENKGVLTVGHMYTLFPFGNIFEKISLRGECLKQVMEHSVSKMDRESPSGRFLQMSGMRVKYDLRKPVGSRVVDISVMCTRCRVPKYEPLDPRRVYRILVNNYLIAGGDDYDIIKNNHTDRVNTGNIVAVVLAKYIERMSPIIQGLEGRIKFVDSSAAAAEKNCKRQNFSRPPPTEATISGNCRPSIKLAVTAIILKIAVYLLQL